MVYGILESGANGIWLGITTLDGANDCMKL